MAVKIDSAEVLDGKRIHPLAAMFPPMSGDEFAAIVADIRANGLIEPVILHGGMILDGCHRLRACLELDIKPEYQEWNGAGGTPFQYVWSRNWSRRHLTTSQRAVIALSAEAELAKVAATRKSSKKRADKDVANLPHAAETGRARDLAGQIAGVSGRYVQEAKHIKELRPDLFADVWQGKLNLHAAKQQADAPETVKKATKAAHRVCIDFHGHKLQSDWLSKKDATELNAALSEFLPSSDSVNVKLIGNKDKKASRMYANTDTWSPFKGCEFACTYCVPSFQRQSKRKKQECDKCYRYAPHEHPERLAFERIPTADTVFVCGNSDVSFCSPEFMHQIIEAIKERNLHSRKTQTFYLQSKKPKCLEPFLKMLPSNVVLVTTLETNRDKGYDKVSEAPLPSERFKQFRALDYPRKVVTTEPVMDFDPKTFADWITQIKPEYVWLGMNSHEEVSLPEPTAEKLREFTEIVAAKGIQIRGKDLRGLKLSGVVPFQG